MKSVKRFFFAAFVLFSLCIFSTTANAQNAANGVGTNGNPIFNVGIPSTSSNEARLAAATTRVGNAPVGYKFWIMYSDGKYESGGVTYGQNIFITYEIKNSTAAWWQFWAADTSGIFTFGTLVVEGFWRYYQMTMDGVIVDSGWDFIVTGFRTVEPPNYANQS